MKHQNVRKKVSMKTRIRLRLLYDVWMERRGTQYASGERVNSKFCFQIVFLLVVKQGDEMKQGRDLLLQLTKSSTDLNRKRYAYKSMMNSEPTSELPAREGLAAFRARREGRG